MRTFRFKVVFDVHMTWNLNSMSVLAQTSEGGLSIMKWSTCFSAFWQGQWAIGKLLRFEVAHMVFVEQGKPPGIEKAGYFWFGYKCDMNIGKKTVLPICDELFKILWCPFSAFSLADGLDLNVVHYIRFIQKEQLLLMPKISGVRYSVLHAKISGASKGLCSYS